MKYKKGYKFQLAEEARILTHIYPSEIIMGDYYTLQTDGVLTLAKGYAWDGASFIFCINSPYTLKATALHDALYQMIRDGAEIDRNVADEEFRYLMIKNCPYPAPLAKLRANAWYYAVKIFGKLALKDKNKILES